jgi:hypothetical protein
MGYDYRMRNYVEYEIYTLFSGFPQGTVRNRQLAVKFRKLAGKAQKKDELDRTASNLKNDLIFGRRS